MIPSHPQIFPPFSRSTQKQHEFTRHILKPKNRYCRCGHAIEIKLTIALSRRFVEEENKWKCENFELKESPFCEQGKTQSFRSNLELIKNRQTFCFK
jgi:hypothetical protein